MIAMYENISMYIVLKVTYLLFCPLGLSFIATTIILVILIIIIIIHYCDPLHRVTYIPSH